MKRLVLVRHAKAVPWGYDDDFSRDLTDRGKDDAGRVSSHLISLGIIPDRIISSPANRALQTAEIFAANFNIPEETITKKTDLYHGMTTGELIGFIQTFPPEINCIFLFGHNPSFEFYCNSLCSEFHHDMPTSSAVIIDFDMKTWETVSARSGVLYLQVNPKLLKP